MDRLVSLRAAIDAVSRGCQEFRGIFAECEKNLNELPSAQSEPTTEIQEILNYLDTTLHPIVSPDNWDVYAELYDMVSSLPSAQPEPCEDAVSREDAIDTLDDEITITGKSNAYVVMDYVQRVKRKIENLPSVTPKRMPFVQPEWNNHTVACLLAELFDDTCACNYNGIDEWLPEKCEVIDACPNPVGVACWEQYLKHRAERRTDEQITE